MPTGKLDLKQAVGLDGPRLFEAGTAHNLNRQEARREAAKRHDDQRLKLRSALLEGAPGSDASYRAATFTPAGIGLRPFSVGQVEPPWRTARSPGDLTIRWIRRSRALAADSWEAAEVPLAEDSEAYAIEIRDGATVKRTLTASTTSALYTAAQQIADWGALLGPGGSLNIRIYQLSALIGRGAAHSVTLNF